MAIEYKINEKDTRPWGTWEVIDVGKKHIVKKITVNPHSSLSLQMHYHREEHWIITSGSATVTIDNKKEEICAGKVVNIPKETKHRMENLSNETVEFIEVQMGDTLDEKDIVRFEDQYNRV